MPKSNIKTATSKRKDPGFFAQALVKYVPDWITPNLLSVLRLIMIPVIIVYLALGNFVAALAFFIAAALLDAIDGALARAKGQISSLGMLLDPLADKVLIMAMIAFLLLVYPFKLLIIYAFIFDFFILLVAAMKISQPSTKIKASNIWGKSKMLSQVAGVSLALLWVAWPAAPLLYISAAIIWLSLVFQIGSAVTYSS